jgi:putative transposase
MVGAADRLCMYVPGPRSRGVAKSAGKGEWHSPSSSPAQAQNPADRLINTPGYHGNDQTTALIIVMGFDTHKHHRRSTRLEGYDYSGSGVYFITICTYQRQHLFGQVRKAVMELSPIGQIADEEWQRSAQIRQEVTLGNWVVMPNHFHGIVILDRTHTSEPLEEFNHAGQPRMRPRSLSSLVAGFKSAVTRRTGKQQRIWHRNYHDYVVRDNRAWDAINSYIIRNPIVWGNDCFYPVK